MEPHALVLMVVAAAGDPGTVATVPTVAERFAALVHELSGYPRWCGPVIAALALIPLFHGWRLIRWTMAVCTAAVTGGAILAFALPGFDPALAWTAAVSGAIIAGLLGFFLYQALVALQGGLLGFVLATLLSAAFAPQHQGVAVAAGLLGGALGFVLGWKVAPYLGIVESVAYACAMIVAGMIILVRPTSDGEAAILALVVAAVTVVPGLVVQLREHHGRPA